MGRFLSLLLVLAVGALGVQSAHSYPKEGRLPDITEESYLHETGDVAEDCGDLLFYGPDEKPAFESLTEAEVLMLGGSRVSRGNEHLNPYWIEITTLAGRYYNEYQVLPSALDPTTIRQIPRFYGASDEELELYRNPLSGDWPRVDAENTPSPGDFYMRVLTPEEAQRYSKTAKESIAFRSGQPSGDLFILYGRMYGEKAPLVSFFSPFSKGAPGSMP
jgi:hypothetical protein